MISLSKLIQSSIWKLDQKPQQFLKFQRYFAVQNKLQSRLKLQNKKQIQKQQQPNGAENGLTEEQKKEKMDKYMVKDGPHLYISLMLNRRGPMTVQQIWNEYRKQRQYKGLETQYFESVTHLRKKLLKTMRQQGKIYSTGYDKKLKQHFGWKLNPDIAFWNVHPEVFVNIEPNPVFTKLKLIKRLNQAKGIAVEDDDTQDNESLKKHQDIIVE